MPAKNPRINVSLEKSIYSIIETLAKEKGVSISMVTRESIKEALEINEDVLLAAFAEEREKTFKKQKSLTHEEVWK
ncbi:MAG: antitoxin, RHH family protein [Spirochaetes bacterium]|nr:antitoxin, RHH family protein [Spirochaetota bacterium]